MKARCFNPAHPKFPAYGGRGITVCERWQKSFANFREEMGPRPSSSHSLDRVDNDGNYELCNCRWSTPAQQAQNRRTTRRITAFGEIRGLTEWAQIADLSRGALAARLKRGWHPERALTTPVHRVFKRTYD